MNEEIILNVESYNPYVIGAVAYVEQLENGAKITIVDKNGTTTATVEDGKDGKSISSIVLNDNYTLTINYEDGSSTTTGSIRGATGASGVFYGEEEPIDPAINVWVDPADGDGSVLKIRDEDDQWTAIESIIGEPAGFGTVTATVDANHGTPAVTVTTSGDDTAKNFAFAFSNLQPAPYDDSELQADFATLQGQFDTAVAAVTTDTEVTDIRVGADGITDTTAGASVRRQFTDLKSKINEIAYFPTNLFDASDATDGYRIDSQGANYIDAGYFVSDFIEVTAGNTYIKNSPQEDAYHRWGIYNASKACISVGTTNTIRTTDATKYIKICGALAEKNTTTLYDSVDAESSAVDRIARNEIENYYKQWQSEEYASVTLKAGSFQQLESNISYYPQSGFRCAKYSIPNGATKIKCDCATLNVLSGYSGGAFYDANGNHISRFGNDTSTTYIGLVTDVPSGASVVYINQSSELWNDPKFFSNANLSEDIGDLKNFIWGSNADIIFWGDSLTAGYGGNGVTFPAVCAANLGLSHLNCGVGGETANTIAARQGGNNIVIPAGDINDTYSSLSDLFGGVVAPLLQGDGAGSGSKLYINGEECSLSSNGSTWTISGYTGGSSDIPILGMFAGTNFGGKITVIFVGQNGSTFGDLTDVDARIAIIDSMIAHLHNNQYIVLGLSSGSDATRNAEDAKLLAHYGNKFFPTRKQVSQYGMTIEGLTPTADDETRMAEGKIPLSLLLVDGIHMNAYGYDALGKLVADKIRSLGYV